MTSITPLGGGAAGLEENAGAGDFGLLAFAPGISLPFADGRYIRRYVGDVLTADTRTVNQQGGGSAPGLWLPAGPVVANIPLNASANVFAGSNGAYFGIQARVIRAGSNPSFLTVRVNGTFQAPSSILNNQTLGGYEMRGYESTAANVLQGAQIVANSSEDWTASGRGTRMFFQTVPIGDTNLRNVFDIFSESAGAASVFRSMAPTLRFLPASGGAVNLRDDADSVTLLSFGNGGLSFFGAARSGQLTVTGSRGGNAALASLLTQLATYGIIVNNSTA